MLNTRVRSLPGVVALRHLRSLILVDSGVSELTFEGLDCLETLDLRRNRVRVVPASVSLCRRLHTLRLSNNFLRQLPAELGQLELLTTFDCAFNRLKRLTTHLVRCAQLRSLHVRCSHSLHTHILSRRVVIHAMLYTCNDSYAILSTASSYRRRVIGVYSAAAVQRRIN